MGANGTCVESPTSARSAQELLAEFQQTGRQEPFEEIARRYAGMVYNVALQVTRDVHDAEDATQATFLTLAVHAKTAGKIRYVGPWLRKVSHRLALDIRRSKKRRAAREQRHASESARLSGSANGNGHGNGNGYGHARGADGSVSAGLDLEELRHILREELDKLPAKYRLPLILYYFGGLSPHEMGRELRVNTSTLGVRLHRGRKMLAQSLSERGVTINLALLGGLLGGLVETAVRDRIVRGSSAAAAHVAAAGFAVNSTIAPLEVLGLMQKAASAIMWSRLRGLIAASVLVVSTIAGAGQVLDRLDLIDLKALPNVDLMRHLRPLLDRIFSPPHLSIPELSRAAQQTGQFEAPTVSVPTLFASPTDLSLAVGIELAPPAADWQSSYFVDTPNDLSEAARQSVASDRHGTPATFALTWHPPTVRTSPATLLAALPDAAHTPSAQANVRNSYVSNIAAPLSLARQWSAASQKHSRAQSPGSFTPGQIVVDRLVVDASSGGASASVMGDAAVSSMGTEAARGSVVFRQGTLRADRLIVGDQASGSLQHLGGRIIVKDELTIGAQPGSSGTLELQSLASNTTTPRSEAGASGVGSRPASGGSVRDDGASKITTPRLVVGGAGNGTLKQSGGQIDVTTPAHNGTAVVAADSGSTGDYRLGGGTLSADTLIVGQRGDGSLTQTGGKVNVTTAIVGRESGGKGTWSVVADAGISIRAPQDTTDGMLDPQEFTPSTPGSSVSAPRYQPTPQIIVGESGEGTVQLKPDRSEPVIEEAPGTAGAVLAVRSRTGGAGTFVGWGAVRTTGPIVQNGQIIADGDGLSRTLDLTTVSGIYNTIENPNSGGTNGWYARDGGRLMLPPITITADRAYNWGETSDDPVIDLVNSVRLTPHGVTTEGLLSLTLLDPGSSEVPALPQDTVAIGVWRMIGTLDLTSLDVLVRYDELLAEQLQLDERTLGLWTFEQGGWRQAQLAAGIDLEQNLVWGTVGTSGLPSYLAVSGSPAPAAAVVPEPAASLLGVALAAGTLLRRRRTATG
ncbi:RNA polymerase sigma factor [Fontivita pretiosa]|uniref:RNA polymerase sigma factor n=1 Tax=Fontivita pretiosa TaxID=2989684 RepID=UPI003D17A23E